MRHMKKTILLLLVLTLAAICFGLVSCGGECNHEWGEWDTTADATCSSEGTRTRTCSLCQTTETDTIPAKAHEWGDWVVKSEASCTVDGVKCRTCSQCAEVERVVTEAAFGHTDDDICSVCGAPTFTLDQLTPTFEKTDSVLFRLENVSIDIENEDFNFAGTIDLAELYLALYEGNLCGYGNGELNIDDEDPDTEASVNARIYIEGTVVYYEAEGLEALGIETDGEPVCGALDLEQIITEYIDIALSELEEALGSLPGDDTENVDELESKLVNWIISDLVPIFSEVDRDDSNLDKLEAFINKELGKLLNIETTENGKTISIDLSRLEDVKSYLTDKKASELIELIFGEGSYAELKENIGVILKFTVSDFIDYLKKTQGIDIDKLLKALDRLAVIVTGDNEADFESLIGLEADISELLENKDFLSCTIEYIVASAMEIENVEQVEALITVFLSMLEQSSVHDLLTAFSPDTAALIDEIFDTIENMLSYVVTLDSNGQFVSKSISIQIPASLTGSVSVSITETVTNDGIAASIEVSDGSSVEISLTAEMLVGYTSDEDMSDYIDIKTKCEGLGA